MLSDFISNQTLFSLSNLKKTNKWKLPLQYVELIGKSMRGIKFALMWNFVFLLLGI